MGVSTCWAVQGLALLNCLLGVLTRFGGGEWCSSDGVFTWRGVGCGLSIILDVGCCPHGRETTLPDACLGDTVVAYGKSVV